MAHEFIRFVPEIGMHAFSRGRRTCLWKTPWCERHCYTKKFYQLQWATDEIDALDDEWWQAHSAYEIANEIQDRAGSDYEPPARIRFSVKGEIWTSIKDVRKVRGISVALSTTHFWIPTRAWRNRAMLNAIFELKEARPNVHVLCSVDPSVDLNDIDRLRCSGMSLAFTGDNNCGQMLLTEQGAVDGTSLGMHRCRKTWENLAGACATCAEGCFKPGRVEVHLKQHK